MGMKKMKLPFLFKTKQWPWPASCTTQPRTLSFRVTTIGFSIPLEPLSKPELSCPTSFSAASEDHQIETMIQGLRAERLFFNPKETRSILEEAKDMGFPFKESLILSLDSIDPCLDFLRSMEEMVEAHGLKEWKGLEELLCSYLKVNRESNHGYILGAFLDLIIGLSKFASCSCCYGFSNSSLCFCNSCCSSSSLSISTSNQCLSSVEIEEMGSSHFLSSSFEDVDEDEIRLENYIFS